MFRLLEDLAPAGAWPGWPRLDRLFTAGGARGLTVLISDLCESFDIDVSHDLIPVRPSAHYTVGGIRIDPLGRTDVPGLFAAGEVASSGLHAESELNGARTITGRSVSEITDLGRPGRLSVEGFLGAGLAPV